MVAARSLIPVALALAACGRPHVGVGPTLGDGRMAVHGTPGVGATVEAGAWLPGERVGVFAVVETPGYAAGGDSDPVFWAGLDVRGRAVLASGPHWRVPFVFGGGLGYEVAYIAEPFASGLVEVGIERDVSGWVVGVRARERLGTYIGNEHAGLSWQSSTNLLVDIGYRFD